MGREQQAPIETDPCPGCALRGDHAPRCLEAGCPGCGRTNDDHDDDCPLAWWLTWDEHREGLPPDRE